MGCQAEVYIGDSLVFSCCCHDPDTGVLTDADSAPTYRVYEDETATAILAGTMAILDTDNTTGFYTEQIACSAGNGFEDGKSYTIYIEATVDLDPGGICYGFRVVTELTAAAVADAIWDEAKADHVASGSFGEEVQAHALSSEVATAAEVWAYTTRTLTQSASSVTAAVSGSDLSIHRGDSLSATITGLGDIAGRTKLWFTVKEQASDPDTAATFQIEETDGLVYINGNDAVTTGNGVITVDDEAAGDITVTLDEAETAKLRPNNALVYDIQVLDSGSISTLSAGDAEVTADVTRVVA